MLRVFSLTDSTRWANSSDAAPATPRSRTRLTTHADGRRGLSGPGRKFDDVCCAQFGRGRGARCFRPGPRASPASGAVTDEQRSPRPNSAQPFGRRFFSAQAALLVPYRSTGGICASLAPCLGRKLLAANVIEFTPLTTEYPISLKRGT